MNKKPFKGSDGPTIVLMALAAMFLVQLVAIVPLSLAREAGEETYWIVNYVCMFLMQAAFLAVYIVYTRKRGIVGGFSPRNKLTVWSFLAPVLIAPICFACFIGLAYFFQNLLIAIGYHPDEGVSFSGTASLVLMIFTTVIAAPIGEETIFRNALLSGLVRVRRDEIGTAAICGACFALMHMKPDQTVYQFLLGCVAGYLVIKCRSVIPSIILHSLSNVFACLTAFTDLGTAIESFYGQAGADIPITLIVCILMPAAGSALIWLICKYLGKHERKKFPEKFRDKRVVWIDEQTHEPIFEGGKVPVVTEENRMVQQGYAAFGGAPLMIDRLERQQTLLEQYYAKTDEKSGALGEKTYGRAFAIYFALTAAVWFAMLISGFFA